MTSPTVGTAEHPFNIDVVQQMGQEGLVIATTNPVTGGIELSAGGTAVNASLGVKSANYGRNIRGFPLAANITSGSGLSIVGQSGNAPTVTYIERDGMRGVRVKTAAGFFAEVTLPTFSKLIPMGNVEALMYIPDGEHSKVSTTAIYIGDNGSYTNSYTESINHASAGCNQHSGYFMLSPDGVSSPEDTVRTEWAVLNGTPNFASTTFTTAKIRITPTAGQSATVEIFGVWVNGSHTLPSVVFTADDGYESVYTTGVPVLEKYGHRLSMAIIGDLVGTSGYMTVAQLNELVSRGHECVVHGPLGGPGNLTTTYTTTAQILADVSYHRDFLISNGLAKNGSENIYVFPQGVYQFSRDDTRVMDAIRAAGFKYARLANVNQSAIVMADQKRLPYYIPIIGHTWSSGDEAGNISRLIVKIQEAAAMGRSVVVMFHKFTSGAAAANIEIQASNLELICKAVADLEAAGSVKNATLGEFCSEMALQ